MEQHEQDACRACGVFAGLRPTGENRGSRNACRACGRQPVGGGHFAGEVCAACRRTWDTTSCVDCGQARPCGAEGRCHACMVVRVAHERAALLNARACQECGRLPYGRRVYADGRCPACRYPNPLLDEAARHQIKVLNGAVCRYYDLAWEALRGPGRLGLQVEARQVLMYLLREEIGLAATHVGRVLRRDHSTVLYGSGRIGAQLPSDRCLRETVATIRRSYRVAMAGGTRATTRPRTALDDYQQARRLQHREAVSYAS